MCYPAYILFISTEITHLADIVTNILLLAGMWICLGMGSDFIFLENLKSIFTALLSSLLYGDCYFRVVKNFKDTFISEGCYFQAKNLNLILCLKKGLLNNYLDVVSA